MTSAVDNAASQISEHQASRKEALVWLYSFLKPNRGSILRLAGLSLVTTAMVVSQPYLTKLIIDDGLLAKDFSALLSFSALLLVIGFGSTLLSGYNRIQHTRLSGNVLFALREDVYGHLLKLPGSFYQRQRTGDIISRVDRDVSEIQRFAVDTLFSSFSAVAGLLAAVSMMVYLNWQLSLVLLLLIPLELAYLAYMRPKVEARNIQVRESGALISSHFAEKIPATQFIQSVGAERHELDNLSRLNRGFLGKLLGLQITEFWTSAIPTTLVSATRAAIFLIGGYWVIEGSFQLGALIAFTTYVGMAIGPVQSLLGLYLAWQRLRVSLDRVRFLRQQPIAPMLDNKSKSTISNADNVAATDDKNNLDIELRDLGFGYRNDSKVLEHVNVRIPQGAKLGIVGQSGSGKTTLLDLIQGHLKATDGKILVGSQALNDLDLQQWRREIAVVPQEPVIFYETLAGNIRYGNPKASETKIHHAAVTAGLQNLMERLPNGLDSLISERGSNLSGGERQRLALARAILRKPKILILDEPTSAVDAATETQLVQQIDDLFANSTRIVVSHRNNVLKDADILLEVDQGQIRTLSSDEFTKRSAA